MSHAPPQLRCRQIPAFEADGLDAVQSAFAQAEGCVMRQVWLAAPEKDFSPATVRAAWRGNLLLVFAELEDADIFSRAAAHNQRMWELGDVLEIFLSPENSAGYVEFHVTPNNFRLQLRFPDTATMRKAQAENRFDHLLLPDGVFCSRTWTQPENRRWFALAEIPVAAAGGPDRLLEGVRCQFSFSRYDYIRGRNEPVISSTSPHAQPNFHRREEWGTLIFV
jgi:Carbohydrate family 9 binding domain-like